MLNTYEKVHHYYYYLHAVSLHPLLQDMVNAYLHFCSHSRGSGRAGRKRQDIPPSPVAGTGPIRCREICLLIASVILDRLQTLDMRIGTNCLFVVVVFFLGGGGGGDPRRLKELARCPEQLLEIHSTVCRL